MVKMLSKVEEVRVRQLYALLNMVAKSGFVDVKPIVHELLEIHGYPQK